MKISQALNKIGHDLITQSGYPNKTVTDPNLAFSYGLVIGSVWAMQREWELKETGR